MRHASYATFQAVMGFMVAVFFLAGCQTGSTVPHPDDSAGECPAEMQGQVQVTASSVPRAIPTDLAVDGTSRSVLARTVMLSVLPVEAAKGSRLVTSTLSLVTMGGTFKNWAVLRNVDRQSIGGRSIDVIPGRIRIAPFLSGPTFQAQTVYLDVMLAPGAVPIDEETVSAPALWTEERQPLPSDSLEITLIPLRHFTAYDAVESRISLTFVATRSPRAGGRWTCSVETALTLIERDAATPALWDLRKTGQSGRSELWLALFDPATGPFRAIFASPADASSFAAWLHQTHSARAGRFELGMFRPQYSREPQHTRPADDSLINTFRRVSADDLDALEVGRLGEL
jgi:hypothetical protein